MGLQKSTGSRAEAVELKMKGLSYAEIGKRFGVSRQRVQQMIRPPKAVYNEVRKRAHGMCQLCFVELNSGHVHHMGTTENWDDWKNLRYLCATCHTALNKNPANGERLRFP